MVAYIFNCVTTIKTEYSLAIADRFVQHFNFNTFIGKIQAFSFLQFFVVLLAFCNTILTICCTEQVILAH